MTRRGGGGGGRGDGAALQLPLFCCCCFAGCCCASQLLCSLLIAPALRAQAVDAVVAMLDTMDKWIDEIPAIDSDKQRFGNPAFRDWMARLDKVSSLFPLTPFPSPQHKHARIPTYL